MVVPKFLWLHVWLASSLLLAGACKSGPVKAPPPPEIPVVEIEAGEVPIEKTFVSQVYGVADIPIRARVEGYLDNIHFEEGRAVKKGQLLYTIDPQPFQAQVAEAKSRLAEAEIALVKAQNDLARVEPLAKSNAVSESELDAAIAEKDAAEAAVEAAQANLRMDQIMLGYTKIKAPISGLIGKTKAKIGEFVGREPNPVILNTVSKIDEVLVEFFLTEQDYLVLARELIAAHRLGKVEREEGDFQLIFADGSVYEYPGKFNFADRQIDPETGSLLIQTVFPNPDRLIRPGQFAKVKVTFETLEDIPIIPQRCVTEFQGLHRAFAINDSNKVEQRTLELVGTYRDYFVVGSGLKPGEKVVIEGLQKVREGMVVVPVATEFESKVAQP